MNSIKRNDCNQNNPDTLYLRWQAFACMCPDWLSGKATDTLNKDNLPDSCYYYIESVLDSSELPHELIVMGNTIFGSTFRNDQIWFETAAKRTY